MDEVVKEPLVETYKSLDRQARYQKKDRNTSFRLAKVS